MAIGSVSSFAFDVWQESRDDPHQGQQRADAEDEFDAGSAFFGWLADRTSIEFIFRVSALLPLMGIITGFLPDVERKR